MYGAQEPGSAPGGPSDRRAVRRFYAHLVASLATQAVVLVLALANGSVAAWCVAVLLGGGLGLGAHAATALRPLLGPGRRR
jgi:hypothetical protein